MIHRWLGWLVPLWICLLVPAPAEVLTEETWQMDEEILLDVTAQRDVFLWGNQRVELAGDYRQDVWAAGRRVNFLGQAGQDVRLAAWEVLTLTGTVDAGLRAYSAGNMLVNTQTIVKGPAVLNAGDHLTLHGRFEGDVSAAAPRMVVGADIGGSLTVRGEDVTILPDTRIGGNLIDQTRRRLTIPDGVLSGELIRREPERTRAAELLAQWVWTFRGIRLVTAFVLGMLLVRFFPRFSGQSVETMLRLQPSTFLLGLLSLATLGLCGYFLLPTLIGTGVGLFMLLILIFLMTTGMIVASLALGATLVKHREPLTYFRLMLGLLVGLLVLHAGFLLPFLGPTLWVIVVSWGAGAVVHTLRDSQRVLKLEIPENLRETSTDSTS